MNVTDHRAVESIVRCPPALAQGLNGWNAPACARAVKERRISDRYAIWL